MVSYISRSTHSEQVFQDYLDRMSEFLRHIGYDAVKSTHNDIMIGQHKVSGNACFALPTGTIVHGTMLFDEDFEVLQQALTPAREKLAKHGVESVRQRVCNLKELGEKGAFRTLEEFERVLVDACSQRRYTLTEQDRQAIDGIEEEYLDPGFICSR
jgi:lipoic acid synthetase/lipoate-protein ligase A